MDDQQVATLSQLFSITKEVCLEKMSEIQSESNADLKEKLKKAANIEWSLVVEHVVDSLPSMMDVKIADIIAKAWCKYKELIKYCDRSLYPPDEAFLLPMLDRTIQSEHHPYLKICLNDQKIGQIDFYVAVSLSLEGLVLKIQDAKIKEVIVGNCLGKGTIMCENLVILERETSKISLPCSLKLGDGIAIMSAHKVGTGSDKEE